MTGLPFSAGLKFPKPMQSRERFIAALNGESLSRPPIWIMRQAGRYLPEYRALKEQHGFLKMVRTPELATEVTLQPLERYPLDAAILFSDILVIPEAMGQPYHFREQGGIAMEYRLDSPESIRRLTPEAVPERLAYVGKALRLIKRAIGESKMLLGFAGSPWTLATYMVEGGSSDDFKRIKHLFYTDPDLFSELMEKNTEAVIRLLRMQIEAGADAVQIFDSWGSACPGPHYEAMSLCWIRRIIAALPEGFPVILFAKNMSHHAPSLASTGARALSVDASVSLPEMRALLPNNITLQGNLESTLLELEPEIVIREATRFLESMRDTSGHIMNLGHGITPQARTESVAALLDTVIRFR